MTTKFVCAAAVIAGLFGTAAIAADAAKPALSPSSQMLVDRLKQADTNHDGNVTKAEWEILVKARFASFDANKDGKLSPDEVAAMLASTPGMTMSAADVLKAYDKDGDGAVSQQEYVDRNMGRFDAWDTNHDGTVSADEQKAEIDRMEAMPKP